MLLKRICNLQQPPVGLRCALRLVLGEGHKPIVDSEAASAYLRQDCSIIINLNYNINLSINFFK